MIIADKIVINGNIVNINGNDNIARFIGTESEAYDFSDLEYLPEDWLGDTDEDGLFDIYEKVIDTDSLNSDTDGDKLPDGYEVLTLNTDPLEVDTDKNGISDADEDFDNDNLNNLGEYKNKTEPYNTDTDEDGLLDGDEVKKYKTDPHNSDTDNDGLSDGDELHIGLDPINSETFGIPDSEYISEQTISKDSKALLEINKNESPYKLSIEVESTGYVEGSLVAKESKYSKSIENNSILGVPFDLSCNNTCHANKTVIKFNISDEYINSNLSAFDNETDMQGIKRYTIFKFFKDSNLLLPIETKYDESSNIVFAEVDELGTYCIVDMEKMFVNFEYNKIPEQNTPQVALFNIDTTEEIEAVADIPMMLSETENEVITNPDTPLDIVFLLQIEGTREDKFRLEVDAIRNSAELIFEAYNDARISIITYDTLACMRYLETDVGSSDGKKQRYLTSVESVNAALNTVEYTYSIDTINRGYPIYVMLNSAEFRENAYKFAFHLANGKAQCGNNAMDTLHIKFIRECGEKNINYSEFIPANCECYPIEEQINADIEIEKTGGMALMPSKGSGNIIYYIIDRNTPKINVPIKPDNPVEEDFNIVLPTSWERITLVDKLNSDNGANSDTDTLTDWEETDTESGLITWNDNGEIQLPTVQECLEKYSDKEYVQNVLEKYVNTVPSDVWNMFLNEEILPIHSNPCNEDTDGDGLNDDLDNAPLDKNIHSFLIYETEKSDEELKDFNFEDRPEDYQYADKSYDELCDMEWIAWPDFLFSNEEIYKVYWKEMVESLSIGDMEDVAIDMIDHFTNGTGKDYHNDVLNKEVYNHENSKKYITETIDIINDCIQDNNGDISKLEYINVNREDNIMVKRMKGKVLPPKYDDKFSGLGICIDGLYGNQFEITSYKFDGTNYEYTVKYTLYDVFGLDSGDISDDDRFDYGFLFGFRSWYILQHYDEYGGKNKPFITYMDFEETIRGRIA